MIEKRVVYTYEDKDYPSLDKAVDAVEGDFCEFIAKCNRLLAESSRITPTQVTAITEVILMNKQIALRLLTTLEEAENADYS
jgi:hypothetical protein